MPNWLQLSLFDALLSVVAGQEWLVTSDMSFYGDTGMETETVASSLLRPAKFPKLDWNSCLCHTSSVPLTEPLTVFRDVPLVEDFVARRLRMESRPARISLWQRR